MPWLYSLFSTMVTVNNIQNNHLYVTEQKLQRFLILSWLVNLSWFVFIKNALSPGQDVSVVRQVSLCTGRVVVSNPGQVHMPVLQVWPLPQVRMCAIAINECIYFIWIFLSPLLLSLSPSPPLVLCLKNCKKYPHSLGKDYKKRMLWKMTSLDYYCYYLIFIERVKHMKE